MLPPTTPEWFTKRNRVAVRRHSQFIRANQLKLFKAKKLLAISSFSKYARAECTSSLSGGLKPGYSDASENFCYVSLCRRSGHVSIGDSRFQDISASRREPTKGLRNGLQQSFAGLFNFAPCTTATRTPI